MLPYKDKAREENYICQAKKIESIEKIIGKVKRFFNNIVNRNSVSTPPPGKFEGVLNGKDVIFEVSLVLTGKLRRIDVGLGPLNGVNTFIDGIIGQKDDIGNFYSEKSGIDSYSNSFEKGKDLIYRKGMGKNEISFVRIKDKEKYLLILKNELFALGQFNGSYGHFLIYYKKILLYGLNADYINIQDLKNIIESFLISRGREILRLFSINEGGKLYVSNFHESDKEVIARNLINSLPFLNYFSKKGLEDRLETNSDKKVFIERNLGERNLIDEIVNQIVK